MVISTAFASSRGGESDKTLPLNRAIRDTLLSSDRERNDLLEALVKDRAMVEGSLINALIGAKNDEDKILAVYLSGLYRLVGTIPELAKIINLETPDAIQKRESLWGQFPVVEALICIGQPVVPSMLQLIKESTDIKSIEHATTVVLHVEGEKVAEFIFQNAFDVESDNEKRARLATALRFLKVESERRKNAK